VKEQTCLVAQLEPMFTISRRDDKDSGWAGSGAAAASRCRRQNKADRRAATPVPLIAPIDAWWRKSSPSGENVTAGEVVLRVHARHRSD